MSNAKQDHIVDVNKKVTAIDWYEQELINFYGSVSKYNSKKEIIEQALEMEKQQIIDAWDNGFANGYDLGKHNITYPDNAEQYYNKTFNK